MNTKSRITVSNSTADIISKIIGVVVLVVIVAWLYVNAATSVVGIQIALGTAAWVTLIGWAFPASDVLAIVVDLLGRFVYDEKGRPIVSRETVRLVWGLWAFAAFMDIALSFYVFDKLNYEQWIAGDLYSAGLITDANRRIIPMVLAIATYALTIMIIHGSRGIIKSSVERYIEGGGNRKTKRSKNRFNRNDHSPFAQEARPRTYEPVEAEPMPRRTTLPVEDNPTDNPLAWAESILGKRSERKN